MHEVWKDSIKKTMVMIWSKQLHSDPVLVLVGRILTVHLTAGRSYGEQVAWPYPTFSPLCCNETLVICA